MTGLRITSLISTLSHAAGGVFHSVRQSDSFLLRHGHHITAIGGRDPWSAADLAAWAPIATHSLPMCNIGNFAYMPGIERAIAASAPDLVVVHGLWQHISVAARNHRLVHGTPYVVHLHGMLADNVFRRRAWRKRLGWALYQRDALARAACLRALCPAERDAVRLRGLAVPVAVIPNGVVMPDDGGAAPEAPWTGHPIADGPVLLFLSRVDPGKGVSELLSAMAMSDHTPFARWGLAIAGWGDASYLARCHQQVDELGLAHRVCFLGPCLDERKAAAFRCAAGFILPSHSEGMPVAVLEAWSYGLPVILTAACNLNEGVTAGAAVSIPLDPAAMALVLGGFASMDNGDRERMGAAGRQLAAGRFSWTRIAEETDRVYRWVLGGGPPPTCVEI